MNTEGVYGLISNALVDEASPVNPDSPYQEAKMAREAILLAAYKNHQL